ncbi:SbcC/MukB-like Walker B domain-containing protein [Dyadobacter subterraneus]|uniref:AAA family ATPase n=1 Tax=Dyadobacter subterraneus TaxID=2773304 RepID=A0ABR9WLD5_9BACT|nr:SbcC/MukB-like Walker B domain-containing protein [Dyadobacter subterraneus]MBE9466328.1 AAA family ATPase [Dyadobacter subterraneus]
MIPKYLKIKGLYSYQSEQEIQFDALTDASLFGIFGAVGSGKSSILEAITFALYGDTERLNRSGDDRTYNMMNLRSDELLIDFECIAGKPAELYRFTVKGRRNSKNFKDVKTFERKAYKWVEGAWMPLPDEENAERIIGLSYDNFRRTIIIPQGRFQEFIELKDAERTRMMKELFQLEKYDLSRKVGTLSKQNDLELSNLDGQLLTLGEVTPEMISAEEIKREEIRQLIKSIHEELATQTELESQFQKIKLIAEKLQLLNNQILSLESQKPDMELREETLRVFEICSLHFKSLFDRKKSYVGAIERDKQLFEKNFRRNAELDSTLTQQKEILAKIQPQYEKRQELLDTAEELGKVIQIVENKISLEKNKGALLRGEIKLLEKEKAIELLKIQKLEKEELNEKIKANLSDIQELSQIKVWYTTSDSLTESRINIKKEADDLKAEIVKQQSILLIKTEEANQLFSLQILPEASQEVIQNSILDYLLVNEKAGEDLNQKLVLANTRLALQRFANSLEDGKPCPLCGAEHHPSVLHEDNSVFEEIKNIEVQRINLQKLEQAIRQFQSPVERIFNQIENLEKQKSTIKRRWTEIRARIDAHDKTFVWAKFDRNNREVFEKHFDEVVKIQTEIKQNEAAIKAISQSIEVETKEKVEKIEQPLQNLRNEILKIENTVSTLSGQLEKVSLDNFENVDTASISEKIEALKNQYKDLNRLYEQTEKQLDILEKEKDTISGSQSILQETLERNKNELVVTQSEIESQLKEHQFESEEWVGKILQKPVIIDQERKAIDQYKNMLSNAKRDLEALKVENEDQHYDSEKHAAVLAQKETLTLNLNNKRKEEGRLDGLLLKMAQDLAKKESLQKDKIRLELRKEHLDDLARLFRSSGFVDYASSIYLQNLIHAANERFHQMTHQQLHLELGEGNSFWVRDLLNGGHMRLLKTLSGGQKFQAALSLALALADHIHVRNESKHNFFFLDEGFGSLDKNALQTVFETLKSLRKENRIVGIISHVEDLQQEIQAYLRIVESEEGSKIMTSWG